MRILKIHRTYKGPDGNEYTRNEIVRNPDIIDIYMRIRTTKDESSVRKFAYWDDPHKEDMKKKKRRMQEALRRIKKLETQARRPNQPKTPRPPKIKKTTPKLKPDLKVKCGACSQVRLILVSYFM